MRCRGTNRVPRTADGQGEWKGTQKVSGDAVSCWPKKDLLKSETMGSDAILRQTLCYGRTCAATRVKSGHWLCVEAAECRTLYGAREVFGQLPNLETRYQTLEAKNLINRDLENA
jgi:hypothetical protein